MANLKRMLLLLAIILPAICFAQPEVCKVSFTGKQPTIKDFARAYLDSKNGYVGFTALKYGTDETINQETLEMCYWNCDNKNEKLVAINHIDSSMGFDDSILTFYRYNAKTKKMKLIEAPFDREPKAIDLVDQDKADKATIDLVLNSSNEDANKFQPSFSLPRIGKDITYRMADPTAIPEAFQREGKLVWDGNGFYLEN